MRWDINPQVPVLPYHSQTGIVPLLLVQALTVPQVWVTCAATLWSKLQHFQVPPLWVWCSISFISQSWAKPITPVLLFPPPTAIPAPKSFVWVTGRNWINICNFTQSEPSPQHVLLLLVKVSFSDSILYGIKDIKDREFKKIKDGSCVGDHPEDGEPNITIPDN